MDDAWAIADGYFDIDGEWHLTPIEARDRLRVSMGSPEPAPPMWFVPVGGSPTLLDPCVVVLEDGTDLGEAVSLPPDLPIGYHELVPIDGGPPTRLVIHPPRCPELPTEWGVAAQIYALWSERSWGIGDLHDLRTIAERVRAAGGGAVLVSPLHQSAPAAPYEDSPYYPSSRRAWGPMLLGLDAPPPAELSCTKDSLLDRDMIWPLKRQALEAEYARSTEPPPLPGPIALWNALCDEFGAEWTTWPEAYRRFDIAHLAGKLRDDLAFAQRAAFHEWHQRRAAEQLAEVAATGIDIIGDLAIGFSPRGADAWEFQDLLALDMRIGAPPDPFNEEGQEWGIAPFIPWRLRNARYEPYIATIRACIRGVQGLRIDHVMGLFRQFWIPAGTGPAHGAYVSFPSEDLLAILCLEAVRAGAFVIGEDLGTVEPRVREALARRRIARTLVAWFEDDTPSEWPEHTLGTVTTHDLPTIAGVWAATDGDDDHRKRLTQLTEATTVESAIAEAHEALVQSPARLRLVSLDDLCAADKRPNYPGHDDEPSWRRRLPLPVDQIPLPVVAEDA